MNKNVISHYNQCDRIRTYFLQKQTQLSTIPLFAPGRIIFNNHMFEFETYISKQSVNLRPLASEKKIYKKIMANCINQYADRGYAQAIMLGLTTIAVSLDFPLTYVSRAADKVAVTRATELRDILDAHKDDLDEITQDIIDEIDEKILNFNTVLTLPTAKIKDRKAEGTEKIPPVILLLKADLKVFSKMINSYLPSLNGSWKEASKIGESSGVRHTSFLYRFVDSITGVPVSKVKVIISYGDIIIEKISSKQGWLRVYSMEMGTYDMTAEHPVYLSVSRNNIPITDTTTAKATIKLIKNPAP